MGSRAGALVAGAVVLLAGCGGDGDVPETPPALSTSSASASPAASPSTSSEPTTGTPSPSGEEAEVLAAYRAFYAALDAAQADPEHSQQHLEPVAAGAQLEQASGAIKANFLAGEESIGAPILRPEVHSIEGDTAVVRDCQDTTDVVRRNIDTQEPLIIGQDPDSIETRLTRVDGVWKVADTAFPAAPGAFC